MLEAVLRVGQRDLRALHGRPRDEAVERALELADVGADVAGDEERDLGGQRDALALGLALQDGDLGLEIGRLDVDDESPLEARAQTVFEVVRVPWASDRRR